MSPDRSSDKSMASGPRRRTVLALLSAGAAGIATVASGVLRGRRRRRERELSEADLYGPHDLAG